MFRSISRCRICKNKDLRVVLDLGTQYLSGHFPTPNSKFNLKAPLVLVKCNGSNFCGLVQLKHSCNLDLLYGNNYGYRSGLNKSMVEHLKAKVNKIVDLGILQDKDLVIDIGSNDGTTLNLYPNRKLELIGIDPTGSKFKKFYKKDSKLISDFFDKNFFKKHNIKKKAKVITSFSMFYDLEDPIGFAKNIYKFLDPEGIWITEQSYLPLMLEANSFDTVCHEHLEYYTLRQFDWIAKEANLKIISVEINNINGGSFSVSFAKKSSSFKTQKSYSIIKSKYEIKRKINNLKTYKKFHENIIKQKNKFLKFIGDNKNKKIFLLGASTKGNVLLQYYGIDNKLIPYVGEVNPDKFNCITPGSEIPIIDQKKILAMKPNFLVILPWHFKDFFLNEKKLRNIKKIFPLPRFEII